MNKKAYSHDLNYFFNPENIPNQELVFEIFDYFETGEGKSLFSPIDFFNLLLWHCDFIKENISKPLDILNNFKELQIQKTERYILQGFVLKWFGGYPVNNFNPQYNTALKLIERQYLSFLEEERLSFKIQVEKLRNDLIAKGTLMTYDNVKKRINAKPIEFLERFDSIVRDNPIKAKIEELNLKINSKSENILTNVEAEIKNDLFVFVSHSSKDKKIAGDFINKILKLCLKIETDQIFFTSFEENTIASGYDFRNAIRANLIKSSLVILIITDNYKESEVCLNEMGAAWVLGTKVVQFIVPPIEYTSVGFIYQPNQLLKLNQKSDITKFIDEEKRETNKIKYTEIERHIADFLEGFSNQIKSTRLIKPIKSQSERNMNLGLEENDIVEIENRDSLYLFQNEKLIHIADDSEFSLYVYGIDKKRAKAFKYSEVIGLIDKDLSIPVLHTCKIVIDTSTHKKWLVVNDERRFLPDSVYRILVNKDPQPKIVGLSHQEVMRVSEGDKLVDVGNRYG